LGHPQKNNDVLESFFTELIAVKEHYRSLVIIAHGYMTFYGTINVDELLKRQKAPVSEIGLFLLPEDKSSSQSRANYTPLRRFPEY